MSTTTDDQDHTDTTTDDQDHTDTTTILQAQRLYADSLAVHNRHIPGGWSGGEGNPYNFCKLCGATWSIASGLVSRSHKAAWPCIRNPIPTPDDPDHLSGRCSPDCELCV